MCAAADGGGRAVGFDRVRGDAVVCEDGVNESVGGEAEGEDRLGEHCGSGGKEGGQRGGKGRTMAGLINNGTMGVAHRRGLEQEASVCLRM